MASDDRYGALLRRTADLALGFLDGLPERPVGPRATREELRSALGGELPAVGEEPLAVVERLARGADPGLVGMAGPRYFGFVIGGGVPAALAADWLTSAWDQNATLYATSPANSVAEEVAASWLLDLLGLPAGASVGFTTGCAMANFTALAAARHAVLARAGWDVEARGLFGAPEIDVVLGEEAHATVLAALQMLGLGSERVRRVPVDGQGRMVAAGLRALLAGSRGPLVVCAQAGNVNTGSFDPLDEIADVLAERSAADQLAWLHVDGAFGLWARASPEVAPLARGAERADSWATDAHKWLNVPYDSGIVAVADPVAHRAAMTISAAYLQQTAGRERDPFDWVPEFSRRARGFTVWAALRSLGREGVREIVERSCSLARRMARKLGEAPGVEILNEVVLNQVLVRFHPVDEEGRGREGSSGARPRKPSPSGRAGRAPEDPPAHYGRAEEVADDEWTREVISRVQAEGTCWLGGTTWQGRAAMRISVSNWSTTEEDADLAVEAILKAAGGDA